MSDEKKIDRLSFLQQEISKHNIKYHQQDDPEISDAQFDELKQELEKLEQDLRLPMFTEIGAKPLDGFIKSQHQKPMFSLGNAFVDEDVEDFLKRIYRFFGEEKQFISKNLKYPIFCELKIDGISFNATYKNGLLQKVATRGDGKIGEEITQNVKTIANFPIKLKAPYPAEIEIRGEIYMPKSDFLQLNENQQKKQEKIFANPRNAASGSLRQLDSNITAARKLNYFAYSVGFYSDNFEFESQQQLLEKFKNFGFRIEKNAKLCFSMAEIIKHYQKIEDIRYELEYDIDGMVYKVNEIALQNRMGYSTKYPRWAIAHKFKAEIGKTIIEDIIVQVGRTGALTPVAILTPVNIGGVMVARASLHNQDEISKKDIRIGDEVAIKRSGDVIPQIIEVNFKKRKLDTERFFLPKNCPSCGSEVKKTGDDAVLRCLNSNFCKAQVIENIKHFISKNAFNIDGFGGRYVEDFYQKQMIKDFADIFLLEQKNDIFQIEKMEGWGQKSKDNLFASINKKRKIKLANFIYALGIRHIGISNAKLLASHFVNYQNFKNILWAIAQKKDEQSSQELSEIDGLGEKIIEGLISFFSREENIIILQKLENQIKIENFQSTVISQKFSGKTVIFTGTLEKISRKEAKEQAENIGFKVLGAVSKNLDFLVYGDKAGSKLTKAKDLGIKTLSEAQWKEFIK